MKRVDIQRFLKRKPESVSFQGTPISNRPNTEEPATTQTPEAIVRPNEQPNVRPTVEATAQENAQSNHYVISVPHLRKKIRHSFDIFEDQKSALDKLQVAIAESHGNKKPAFGEMVQEAIDRYIREQVSRLKNARIFKLKSDTTNEQPNVRSNDHQ